MLSNHVGVRSLPEDWDAQDYDLFITTVGYERRARYIADQWDPLESTCRHASLSIL